MAPRDELDELLKAVPPSDVVGRKFSLKGRVGGRWWHGGTEDCNSLVVDDQRLSIFWNSREWRGDAISWLRQVEGLDFHEAVNELRRLAGQQPKDRPRAKGTVVPNAVERRVVYVDPARVARYCDNLKAAPQIQQWLENEKGICDWMAEDALIGYSPNHTINMVGSDGHHFSKSYGPTVSIPYTEPGTGRYCWVQHRIMNPAPDSKMRYAPEMLDMGVSLYNAEKIGDAKKILIVEGAFKSIVLQQAMSILGEDIVVVGVPNCSTFCVDWEAWVKGVKDIVVCLDPPINAFEQNWVNRLSLTGHSVRVMSVPDKPDDLLRKPRGYEVLESALRCAVLV